MKTSIATLLATISFVSASQKGFSETTNLKGKPGLPTQPGWVDRMTQIDGYYTARTVAAGMVEGLADIGQHPQVTHHEVDSDGYVMYTKKAEVYNISCHISNVVADAPDCKASIDPEKQTYESGNHVVAFDRGLSMLVFSLLENGDASSDGGAGHVYLEGTSLTCEYKQPEQLPGDSLDLLNSSCLLNYRTWLPVTSSTRAG